MFIQCSYTFGCPLRQKLLKEQVRTCGLEEDIEEDNFFSPLQYPVEGNQAQNSFLETQIGGTTSWGLFWNWRSKLLISNKAYKEESHKQTIAWHTTLKTKLGTVGKRDLCSARQSSSINMVLSPSILNLILVLMGNITGWFRWNPLLFCYCIPSHTLLPSHPTSCHGHTTTQLPLILCALHTPLSVSTTWTK